MNSIFSSIAKRAKKLMIILIILPLLAGLVGYVMEKKAPATYTAKATIELGTWQNQGWTNPQFVANRLTMMDNLKNWTKNPDYVESHLIILPSQTNQLVHVEYTGTSLTEAKDTLTSVINGFMKQSDEAYNEKVNIVQSGLDALKNTENPNYDKAKDMIDIKLTLHDYNKMKSRIYENVSVLSDYVNPLKRGLFGVIIGLMLDMIILALPELFRDFR
jgi:teichuronic acid biosynthesis protein TuaF